MKGRIMNQLIENVYTVFNKQLSEYNKQRSEKIELAYVGECQGFYVFAGDWQNLFLIDNEGGFEIYLKNEEVKTVTDIEANSNWNYKPKAIMKFNFKLFIKWLYKRNPLVKQINWTNLKVIKHIQKCNSKIEQFDADYVIDEKTGKICGAMIFGICPSTKYYIETFNYKDKPHCILKFEDERYKFYLPDTKPKTQKELEIIPDFPFKKELYKEKIKNIKSHTMKFISQKSDGEKHMRYYEALLIYRAFNPDIKVEKIKNKDNSILNASLKNIKSWSFCNFAVNEYAKKHNINPFKILAEMYDKGYINYETRIDYQKKEDFIKEYSYLCDSENIKGQ